MAQQEKKSKAELAAQSCGMTVEQWQRAKSQNAAARGRGKRPAGTAGADVRLASWGEVEGQEQLFTDAGPPPDLMTSEGTNPLSDLWTFDDEDGALHCVGAGDADTVLRVMRVHAENYDCAIPGDDAEAQLRRGWFRELDPAGDCDTQFVPCSSHDPRSVLITTWTPR